MTARVIAILYSGQDGLANGTAEDALASGAVLEAVAAVESSCRANGWIPFRFRVEDLGALRRALRASRPDLAFNLVEDVGGFSCREPEVPLLLESMAIRYTGSAGDALALAADKLACRARLAKRGLPVARGGSLKNASDPLPRVAFPVIVKASREDASHGLSAASVTCDESSTRRQVAFVVETYQQPALVEEFLPGRELNVSLLDGGVGPITLAVSEIDFSRLPPGAPRIVDYRAKWVTGSPEDRGTVPCFPDDLDPSLRTTAEGLSVGAWHALGLRGYARVDLRLDAQGEPKIIDVNPNPDLSPDAGLSLAARRAGLSHQALVARIVKTALAG
jgi:D-alanine-D-alanine ligase